MKRSEVSTVGRSARGTVDAFFQERTIVQINGNNHIFHSSAAGSLQI
jgi:hypothetical protein